MNNMSDDDLKRMGQQSGRVHYLFPLLISTLKKMKKVLKF